MNNDQLRAMYNSYGTLNRPQSYGDELYNDRENMMPSAGQELTQTGTDEAGNPVMAPAEAPEAPRQEQAPLNNLIDFARSRMEQSLDNGSYITAGAGVWAPVVEGMRDLWNATPEERVQMLNVPQRIENAVRGVIHGMSNATELEHTQLYENYFYNPQRKNDEINRISKLLQIDGNAFANDRELYQKAALAADRVERMGKFKKYQDAQGNIDMAKIYADIPGLADIQKQQGTAAAALALGNIDGVRSINDVYNNAFTRFVGSVYAGARRGWISDRRSSIWNDARKENRLPNAEEQKELDAYDAELRELPKYNYNTVGNVAGAMVGGAMENMAMIVKSQGAGALAGLAAGRVGGVRAASIARNAASTYVMSQMIAGNQYEELVNRTDVNGRPMYTPEQASWLALAQGAGEAVLEQYSLTQIGKAIFGRSAAKSITEIIKNSPTLEAAKAGVREYASTKIREATKAGLISLGSEAAEEFNQAASDMLMENVAQVMINGKDAELSSIDDILTNSTGQMLEALPAIGGFGLIGFGAHPVANTRAVLGFRSHVRDVVNNKILIGRMANAHYSEVLNGVWDNKKNIKELQDKAPEVAQTILDAQNKIAGIESGFVDVRALRQQEGGEALVQDIAERNNISADELAACLDGSGMLQVKTSTLMQMDLQDAERKAIMDNVTTSLDAFTEAQTKEAVKLAQDQMKSLQNFNDKTYKAAVDNIIAARFPDAEQAKLAREIIETNYDNPQEEFKRRLDAVNAEINEEIEPVLRELRSGMKQGVIFGRDAEGYATGQRISNNDPWYSNWYADHGRAPNKRELENLAIDIASGRQDPRYGLPTYQNNTDESREYYAGVAEKLDNLEEQRDALEAIQDRMRDLNPGEMVATASLSKEGLKVYDAMRRMMGESENADVQKAGRFNALFLARYADNMAKVFSKVRNAPYTAEDFVRDRFRIDVNAEYNEEQMPAQLFQVSPEEFAKQKEAVRKQYENTDQWLKAPNGKDTNLTEDQWVTVRTDAFKNWFGDWENDPENVSKVLDENGEPLVVKHWTMEDVDFDTFSREFLGDNTIDNASEPAFGATSLLGFWFNSGGDENLSFVYDRDMDLFLSIENPKEYASLAELAYFINIEDSADLTMEDYQRAAAELKEALQNEGYDGIVINDEEFGGKSFVAFEPNQIKDASGRNVGFDPASGNIYLQEAMPERDLVAYHNMSENSVLRSAALGGLPVPSIAVTRKDIPFDQFGEITLIGGSDIVDPANNSANEIFSRDAWTVTFPKTVYDKIKTKDVNNLLNTFKSSFNALGDEGRREASELDYILNGDPSIDNAKHNLSKQLAVMYHYVTQVLGKPVKVPFEKVKGGYDYLLKHKEISDMVREMRYDYFQNDEMKARFSNAVHPYIEAEMKKEHGEDAAKYVKVFFTEEGYFSRNLFDNLTYELRDYGKTKLNERKLKAELKKKIKEADYEKFIDEQINTLYKNPQIMVGKKRMPITLDNIVAAMSALRGAGKQESLTYGDNKALAAMSKKFKSLDELRKKKSNLTTQEKANLAVQIYKEKADAYREVVGGHYKWKDSWDKWDDANKALVMAAKKGGSESAIRTALLRNDFENIDNAVIDAAKEVINAAKDMQTDYFEAKPLRAVGFNEFAAAVVPNGTSKETIDYLKSQGIAVTKYNPKIEGDRQAKTQKAAQKANVYFQQSRGAKGSLSLNQQGQRIINLFESADQSTFVHEMSHMFLLDLQEVAGIDPNSQQAKDLKTIMDWAEYKPGQADEYKGTASAEEFRRREADIQAAEKAGNTLEARRLKDIWAQERFARGFEEYLKSGEAPAAGLKRAFRQFKKWLVQIYNDVLGAGVRATPEVEAIMARMVASEDEIEAMAAANNIARLQKVDPDILSEDAQALRDRWQEEVKERAKEKMLRELMKQYEQQNLKDLDKRLEDVRTSAREELQEMPYFVCEQLLADGTDMASALEICGYGSEQEYRDALKEAGGGMEKALDKMVAQARENMLKEMPSKDALYTMAEEALLSGDYNTRLATLEAEMLKAREASYRNAPARLRRALTEVDEAIKNFETQAVRQAVQKLKYAERWGTKDLQTIQELEKHLADLDKADAKKEEKQKVKEQFEAKYRELKQRTVQNEQWLRDVRDATDGKLKAMRIMARAQMANQQLSAATNPRHWHRQALSEGKKAWQEISRAQRKGEEVNARQAVRAKETQAYFDAMTAEAIKNRQKVDRMLNNARGIKARGKRMADPKFKADANLRYFHNHLLYVYGLRNSDAIAPAQEKTFTDVLAELRASHQFEEEVPAWLIAAAEATTQEKNYQQLTLGEFEELDKLTKVLYTLAKNQNQLLTLDVDMDTVVADCGTDWMNHVDYEVGNQRINEVKGAIGDYMNGLLKPEVLLSIMGGKDGGFIKYIYRVLFKAAEAEEIAREKEAAAQKALYSHYYTQQELRAMVNDPVMVDGPDGKKVKLQIGDDTDITKENLICMALNWGNEANRARLVVGLFDCENETELAQKQAELMDVLAHTLTEKDWQFVQAMWDHINTFANPVSEVLEKSVGVPLDRVKADAFSVDLPDGQQLNMAGGYYPIVKDSGKSSRQSEFDQLEEAKAVGGVSVFGTGMSATKARTDNLFLNHGPLKLTLDVAHKHIQAQIHLIHAKMAVRDAYKVLNNKAIKDMIRRTCGEGTVKTMNEWVLNCWAPPVRPHSWYESMAASLRSKTVGAIMGYRVSTALLNLANVVYMAQEIGTKNALSAMADFYRHPMENRQAILDVSVFMRNRATNMDRDLGAQEEQFLKRHNMVGNAIDKATGGKSEEMRYLMDKYANWLIEQTDMLVSMPLYQWQFKETYSAEIAKGVPEEEARETANFEATRRVTKVFGSSRALDSSSVQRSKNEIVKLITPFFTFANTMMNAVWSHYYEGKYTADKKTFSRRYAAFARAMLFNFVLGALVETMLRQVPDMLAGSGGDDDDDKFMKDVGKNVIANAVAGFPGVNEFINTTYELFTEKKNYGSGRGVGVLSGSVERAQKVIQDMAKITQGGDKIDAIDFFRDVARAANVKTGMSDTITDAVFNTVRFAADGYSLDNMDDLREYIAKTLFDRKLKKK